MTILLIYVVIFVIAYFAVKAVTARVVRHDFTSLKTVTFGDESAVRPNRAASIISVATIFLIWGAFTGSSWVPIHAPGPFVGDTSFKYTASRADGTTDTATVQARVFKKDTAPDAPEVAAGDGFAQDDALVLAAWRSKLIKVQDNDDDAGGEITVTAVNGEAIEPGGTVQVDDGRVTMTPKGTLNFVPAKGWQMEPIWLPSPEAVVGRLIGIAGEGYQNSTLLEHLGWSLFRVVIGFLLGAAIGIPLGYAMGLSDWFRGWFDPIVEFMTRCHRWR